MTGIGECTVLRETGGVALLSLQGAPDLRPKVVRALVQNGIDVLRIDRGAARLESIFLQADPRRRRPGATGRPQ